MWNLRYNSITIFTCSIAFYLHVNILDINCSVSILGKNYILKLFELQLTLTNNDALLTLFFVVTPNCTEAIWHLYREFYLHFCNWYLRKFVLWRWKDQQLVADIFSRNDDQTKCYSGPIICRHNSYVQSISFVIFYVCIYFVFAAGNSVNIITSRFKKICSSHGIKEHFIRHMPIYERFNGVSSHGYDCGRCKEVFKHFSSMPIHCTHSICPWILLMARTNWTPFFSGSFICQEFRCGWYILPTVFATSIVLHGPLYMAKNYLHRS